MKKFLLSLTIMAAAICLTAVAQTVHSERPPVPETAWPRVDPVTGLAIQPLPRFDMDFPGGTPKELVAAIEKATDKKLNVVIPKDATEVKIPAISVKNVTVAQLFPILERASVRTGHYHYMNHDANSSYHDFTDSYGFRTDGIPHENSIWYLHMDKLSTPQEVIAPVVCQFYQLGPYLDADYTVADITTTIETGWKMLGEGKKPEITYHKDTRVLVAVGEKHRVAMIGEVLKQLPTDKVKTTESGTAAK
jgi:hypothetical protein